MRHPDRWALGVLAEILDTILTQDIRYKRGLVYGIDVYPSLYTDVGHFVVYTVADSARFPEILAEVERQIERVIAGELDEQEVVEAKSAIRGRLLLGMESNSDFAWWLAGVSLFTPEGQAVPNLVDAVDAVTPGEVVRVARRYLSPAQRYQAIHRPGLTPARLRRPALVTAGLAALGLGAWLYKRRHPR
jgi:zinc protease